MPEATKLDHLGENGVFCFSGINDMLTPATYINQKLSLWWYLSSQPYT
jgi:hypothetical protein